MSLYEPGDVCKLVRNRQRDTWRRSEGLTADYTLV